MNKIEKKAYLRLIDQGYLVEKAIKTKWHRTDLFSCWDFIAINDHHIRFIQVSTKYFTERKKEDQEAMLNFPQPPCVTCEYWHWQRGKKEPRITLINQALRDHLSKIRNSKEECQKEKK
jgi:hypothetical protein